MSQSRRARRNRSTCAIMPSFHPVLVSFPSATTATRDSLDLCSSTTSTTGTVTKKLQAQAAGPLNHSRWLTLAIRIQQLYTRTPIPIEGHQMVVDFIQKVYAPPQAGFGLNLMESSPEAPVINITKWSL